MTISKNMFKELFTAVSKRVEDFDQFEKSKKKLVFTANGVISEETGFRRGLFVVMYEEIDEQLPQFISSSKN